MDILRTDNGEDGIQLVLGLNEVCDKAILCHHSYFSCGEGLFSFDAEGRSGAKFQGNQNL